MTTKYCLYDKDSGEFLDYSYDPEIAERLKEWVEKAEGIHVVIKEMNDSPEGLDDK